MNKTIKTLPLVAAIMVASFVGGKAMMKKVAVVAQTENENWVYTNAPGCIPTNSDCYERYEDTGSLSDVCEPDEYVCGIVAPSQDNNSNKPKIEGALLTALSLGNFITGEIYSGPEIVE